MSAPFDGLFVGSLVGKPAVIAGGKSCHVNLC